MQFAGISYLAVLAAGIGGFLTGAVWYTVLGKLWLAALGKSESQVKPTPGPFIVAAIGQLVMAFMFAGIVGHLGEITVINTMISAIFIWIGFIVTTLSVNHTFQGASPILTLIDTWHWLAVLLVMGLIIGLFGT